VILLNGTAILLNDVYLNGQLHTGASEKQQLDAVRMAEKKTMILTIRVEESVGKALKELAEADERKLSAYVARVLRRHIETETKVRAKPRAQR
jgi:hypothetical protein